MSLPIFLSYLFQVLLSGRAFCRFSFEDVSSGGKLDYCRLALNGDSLLYVFIKVYNLRITKSLLRK